MISSNLKIYTTLLALNVKVQSVEKIRNIVKVKHQMMKKIPSNLFLSSKERGFVQFKYGSYGINGFTLIESFHKRLRVNELNNLTFIAQGFSDL